MDKKIILKGGPNNRYSLPVLQIRGLSEEFVRSLTIEKVRELFVKIQDAPKHSSLTAVSYLSRLWREGELPGIMAKYKGRNQTLLTKAGLKAYDERKESISGARRYNLVWPAEQEEWLRDILEQSGQPYKLELAYRRKGGKDTVDWLSDES